MEEMVPSIVLMSDALGCGTYLGSQKVPAAVVGSVVPNCSQYRY